MAEEFLGQLQDMRQKLLLEQERQERRIASAQAVLANVRSDLAALDQTEALYRKEHGLAAAPPRVDNQLRERFANMSSRDMAIELARQSGGTLVVTAAAQLLVKAGIFKDARNAGNNLYTILDRSGDLFVRVAAGKYKLRDEAVQAAESDGKLSEPANLYQFGSPYAEQRWSYSESGSDSDAPAGAR